ncbi:MAG: PAS domain S-box protein [Planctomycetaceae bacterium]
MANRSHVLRYGVALAAVILAIVLPLPLSPVLDQRVSLITYFAAVMVAAWFGGLGPALLAMVLSAFAACYFQFPPTGHLLPQDGVQALSLLMFLAVGGTIAALTGSLRRSQHVAAEIARQSRAERERYFVTLSSIGDGVIATDTEGRVTFINGVAERLTGWAPADAEGRPLDGVFRIVNEETRQPVENPVTKALRLGEVVGLANHTVLIARDGTERAIDDSAAPIRDEHGRVVGVILVFRDVEDARRLKFERDRFAAIVESSEDAILGMSFDLVATHWNDGAAHMFGFTADEVIGRPLVETILPEDRVDELREIHQRLRRGERVDHFETVRRYRDGRLIDVSIRISPVHDEKGRIIGASAIDRDITARLEVERRLRRSEEELSDFFENAAVGLHWVGLDGTILRANQAELDLLGYSRDEYVGRHITEFHADRDNIDDILDRLLRGEVIQNREARLRRKDGSLCDVLIDTSGFWEDGRFVHSRCFTRDVSERKRAEQQLRDSEERLRLALDAGRMGTWQWNVASGEVIWSPGLERIHGLAPGTFAGTFEAYQQDIHPEDRDRVLDTIRRTVDERRDHNLEYRIVWPDGSIHWLEARGKLIFDERGAPERLVGICADVTEAKRHEATLRFLADASKSLAALVDYRSTLQAVARLAVPDFADWCAVDILDDGGQVERLAVAHVDPRKIDFVKRLQDEYPPDPDVPQGAYQVLRTGEPEFVPAIDDEMLRNVARDEVHLRLIRELGLASYIAVPLKAHDRTLGVLTFATAESGRRFRPDDLDVAEDLARRATIAIENAQLYQEVREAGRRKDEFLAMLAHELRNPLAPIRSGLDILRMEPNGQKETVELMQRQVEHLVRLVDDLLDVSRIMRGKVELRRQPTRIATIVQRATEAVRWSIDDQEQALAVELPDEAIVVDVDPVRLVQVIENLLNNASKYTDQGGRIAVAVERRGRSVLIHVRDDGIGIDEELLPRIFDLFTQSSRSLDRAQGGLGIGLTLVRSLVEGHGGTISARSAGPGKGSEFTVCLPVTDAVPLADDAPLEVRPALSRRVLVVDDNVGAVRMLSLLLQRLGPHEVATAQDGPSALRMIAEFRPEVVLLDIGLPGMDGYEVAARVRKDPAHDDVLLVALTGYGQEEDRRKSRRAGFDEHLVKPPALDQIARVLIRRPLRARRPDAASAVARRSPSSNLDTGVDASHTARLPASTVPPVNVGPTSGMLPDDERMGAFFRSLAHEIGNSLVPIRLMFELLKRPNVDADTVASVTEMLDQHLPSMGRLVDDLRRIGRIAAGRLTIRAAEIEPRAVVDAAVAAVAPRFEERRQTFDVDMPESLPRLEGDFELLQHALTELLRNAAQYSPPESRISLKAEQRDGAILFRVRNPGGGIAPDLLPHVFELFVRGDDRLDAEAGNWGVGLTFVRQVVRQHGGRVGVRATNQSPDCEFTIELPLAPVSAPVSAPLSAPV